MKGILLSISYVVFNPDYRMVKESLASLLQSVRILSGTSKIKITIIDNGPYGNSDEVINGLSSWLLDHQNDLEFKVFSGHGNVGYGAGHNLALNEINSDFHLILNPDAFLDEDAFAVGIKYLVEHPDVAMVVPQVFEESGGMQYTAKRYPSLFILFLRGFFPIWAQRLFRKKLDHYELRDKIPATDPVDIDIASGCFMLARTSVLKEVGGFDESFFMYFEDFDLSLRLREKYRIVYLPDMKIIHLGGNAAKKGFKHIKYFCTSAFKFFNKHGWKWV